MTMTMTMMTMTTMMMTMTMRMMSLMSIASLMQELETSKGTRGTCVGPDHGRAILPQTLRL
eukprot:5606449-Prorocentrum_lima.AAC.1